MAVELFTNRAYSTVANDPLADDGLTLNLASGHGARFASPTGGDYQKLVLVSDLTDFGAAYEIVKVTARSTDALTIVRAQDGTAAAEWPAGTIVAGGLTAGSLVPRSFSDLDDTPSPNQAFAANDFFLTGSSIDTGGTRFSGATAWTARLVSGLTNAVGSKALTLTLPQTAAAVFEGYTQPWASGTPRYQTAMLWRGKYVQYHAGGLFVEVGTGASRKTMTFMVQYNNGLGQPALHVSKWTTDSDTFSATLANLGSLGFLAEFPIALEIGYDGTTIHFDYSIGINKAMRRLTSEAVATFLGAAPDRIGVCLQSQNGSGGDCSAVFNGFWRVT